jgi:hypothetical protein
VTLPADAPPVLAQVAQRYDVTSRGVVAFQMHRVFDVHAGFSRRHEDLVMEGVYDDGALVKVHVQSYAIDGKPAAASDVASLEASWDHPKPGDVFAVPFDSRNFGAYEYRSIGSSAIGFTSSIRDAGHGQGTFTYDAQANVTTCTYQPNALPPHASWGEITDRRAEVLPGYWATTQETQAYRGTYGIFSGSGAITVSYSNFQRFADLPSALRQVSGL